MSKALSTTQGGNNNSRTVSESQNSNSKDDGFAEVEVDVNGDTNVLVEHDQLQMQSSEYLLEKIGYSLLFMVPSLFTFFLE